LVCLIAFGFVITLLSGCAYYNYFYNAQRYYEDGEKQRQSASSTDQKPRKGTSGSYDKCVESAGKMLLYYPGSRWEPDALLLIAKAYYRTGKYRSAISKVDELLGKYPKTTLAQEGMLWKGMSLLKVAQPDSARMIITGMFNDQTAPDLVAQGRLALGEDYYNSRRYDDAIEQYIEVPKLKVTDIYLKGEAWIKLGQCYNIQKRYNDAVKLFDDVLKEKLPRRLRFEATLQRAISLRESGKLDPALVEFETLLKDGAFIDDFSRIDLEAARCLKKMGRFDEAKERLQKLTETEKRGEIGAQIQYELGLLLWEKWRDYVGSSTALKAVKTTERTATVANAADSLLAEVDALSKQWRWLVFLDKQFMLINSGKAGLRPLTIQDTTWVDSSAASMKDNSASKNPKGVKGSLKGKDKNAALRKMVDAAIVADSTGDSTKTKDSTKTVADSLVGRIDSLSIVKLDSLRRQQRQEAWFDLAEYHLFERSDTDSATIYFDKVLADSTLAALNRRAKAALAFIAVSEGDSARYDSLYKDILSTASDPDWKSRAQSALRVPVEKPPPTQIQMLLDSAETIWFAQKDPAGALKIYQTVATVADTTSNDAARALLAIAFLIKLTTGADSTASPIYAQLEKRFPDSDFSRLARKKTGKAKGGGLDKAVDRTQQDQDVNSWDEGTGMNDETSPVSPTSPTSPTSQSGSSEQIFEAATVDEPPTLLTSSMTLKGFLRDNYPFEALNSGAKGKVELEFVVHPSGETSDVKVMSADPKDKGFERAAQSILNMLQYRAGRNQGKVVSVRMRQVFEFPVPGGSKP
jgi:TonB family protein